MGMIVTISSAFHKEKEQTETKEQDEDAKDTVGSVGMRSGNKQATVDPNENNDFDVDGAFDEEDNSDEEDDEDDEDDGPRVPLLLLFIILASYIYLGSVSFMNIETWTNMQSAYFSYISLSTIG
jgi:hypothetical protein